MATELSGFDLDTTAMSQTGHSGISQWGGDCGDWRVRLLGSLFKALVQGFRLPGFQRDGHVLRMEYRRTKYIVR
jgi:hypothetical protein